MRNNVLSAEIGNNHSERATAPGACVGLAVVTEYLKGEFCPHRAVFCQEGYCAQCAIYVETHPSLAAGEPGPTKPGETVTTSRQQAR
jgi:hypothetical protein